MNIGIILGGGIGRRFGGKLPKQLIELNFKPLLLHSLGSFETATSIAKFIVVSAKNWRLETEAILRNYRLRKLEAVISGGATRFFSTWEALKFCKEHFSAADLNLCIHDAVRPFIEPSKINELLDLLKDYRAATLVNPVVESLLEYDDLGMVKTIPNRDHWATIQTPQVFDFQTLYRAYADAIAAHNFTFTDDCGVLLRYQPQLKIKTLEGSPDNIKITHPNDLHLAHRIYDKYLKFGR